MNLQQESKKTIRKRNVDYEVWGDEPVIAADIVDFFDVRIGNIFAWYNYFYTRDDGKEWIIKWMTKNNYDKKDIDLFSRCPHIRCGNCIPSLAKQSLKGHPVSAPLIKRVREYINEHIEHYKTKASKVDKPEVIIRDRVKEKIDSAIADLDDEIDIFVKNNFKSSKVNKSIYQILSDKGIKDNQAKKIREYFSPLLVELESIQTDSQLKEAYKDLTSEQKNNYLKFVKDLLRDIDRLMINESVVKVRKPRKLKEKPASQLVRNVKYKHEDKDLSLVSRPPEQIIGAKHVWLYNTKYKILRYLITNSDKGFTIAGTTVSGFDPDKSEARTIRKPETILPEVLSQPKAAKGNLFNKLTTTKQLVTGRINEDTLILRISK